MGGEAHRRRAALALVAVGLVLAVAACGGGGGGDDAASSGDCKSVDAPKPEQRTRKQPTTTLDASKTWDVELQTNCGSFTIRLDVKSSPKTASSFASLARTGFFDQTIFHRIVPGFVIQ